MTQAAAARGLLYLLLTPIYSPQPTAYRKVFAITSDEEDGLARELADLPQAV
jgi:hypothetical protein